MMTLDKGTLILEQKRIVNGKIRQTISSLTWKIIRVNRKTYTLECVEGYLKGSRCNLVKDFCQSRINAYGIETRMKPLIRKNIIPFPAAGR